MHFMRFVPCIRRRSPGAGRSSQSNRVDALTCSQYAASERQAAPVRPAVSTPPALGLAQVAPPGFYASPGRLPPGLAAGEALLPGNTAPRQHHLVGGFVLRDDRGGNTPALIDLVAALLSPLPDLRAAL